MKTNKKLQIANKSNPKWIPPEKRMKTYADFGYKKHTDDITKVRFPKFKIVVPTEWDKQQLQAACEYLHDNRLIDTDFLAVNCLVHSYLTPERETGCENTFVIDDDTFHHMEQATCPHVKTFTQDGIKYCDKCFKALEVTSYRD